MSLSVFTRGLKAQVCFGGLLVLVAPVPGQEPSPPVPVAPAVAGAEALILARCPTFSWTAVERAAGFELAVFETARGDLEANGEPRLVLTVPLSAGSQAWSPSLESCLERGGRYAWSIRALDRQGEGEWSELAFFSISAQPTPREVEAALETLRRYERFGDSDFVGRSTGESFPPRVPAAEASSEGASSLASSASATAGHVAMPSPRPERVGFAAAPSLGTPSLRVDANVALGPASNLFKDDVPFLWDDDTGNVALGRAALASATSTDTSNTAVGRGALQSTASGFPGDGSRNTAVGNGAMADNTSGDSNTAIGYLALEGNTTGDNNTAIGTRALNANNGAGNTAAGALALSSNTSGDRNAAFGYGALSSNEIGENNVAIGDDALSASVSGSDNIAIGSGAGSFTNGSDNILIGNAGATLENNTTRIGSGISQFRAFIAGIRSVTTGSSNAIPVLIDGNGQLGTTSSSRSVKQDVRDVGDLSRRLLDLRPVAFRYREHAARGDQTLQFGLIAEEVAEVFPELVVRDAAGAPETVRYHLLSVLLLNELQRRGRELTLHRDRIEAQKRRLEQQTRELDRLHDLALARTPSSGGGR